MEKILIFGVILLFIVLALAPCIKGGNKFNTKYIDNIKKIRFSYDCACENSDDEDYPSFICAPLFLLMILIGVPGDLLGIFLIYIGFTRETIERIFAPLINSYDFIRQLWLELDCPNPIIS